MYFTLTHCANVECLLAGPATFLRQYISRTIFLFIYVYSVTKNLQAYQFAIKYCENAG